MTVIMIYIAMPLIGFAIAAVLFAVVLSRSNYISERKDVVGRYAWVPEFDKGVYRGTKRECLALEKAYCVPDHADKHKLDRFEKVHVILEEGADVNVIKAENRHYTPESYEGPNQTIDVKTFGIEHLNSPEKYDLDDELPPLEETTDIPLFVPKKEKDSEAVNEMISELMGEQYDFDEELPEVSVPLFKPKE